MPTMTSPWWMPPRAAGPLRMSWFTSAPSLFWRPNEAARSGVSGWMPTPSQPRTILPTSSWRQELLGGVDGNGKTDTLPAGRDGGVDADHLTVEIEERPAGVARIDEGIALDEVVVGARTDGTFLGRDQPVGHRGEFETEGIADGDHPIADL